MCQGESHALTHVNYFVFPLIPILTRDIQVRGLKVAESCYPLVIQDLNASCLDYGKTLPPHLLASIDSFYSLCKSTLPLATVGHILLSP